MTPETIELNRVVNNVPVSLYWEFKSSNSTISCLINDNSSLGKS